MTTNPAPTPPKSAAIGLALVAVLAVVGALLFSGTYLAIPQNGHFYALIAIGVLSLVFALAAYLGQAVAPDPMMPRALAWGFAGLGFFLLLGTVVVNPTSILGFLAQLLLLIVVLLFLALTLVGGYWRYRSVALDKVRLEHREGWQASEPRSALDYSAAQHERDVTQTPPMPVKGQP